MSIRQGDTLIAGLPNIVGLADTSLSNLTSAGNAKVLPTQTSQAGKFLTTDGTSASWANVDALPAQSGQSGKFLTTNGTSASWTSITIPTKISDLTDDTNTAPIAKANTLTDLTATAAELNVLDGITATTTELNVLDGITATTTELNYVDGVTSNIQTQLNGKVVSNAAITGATKTKITYDSKGLVTGGADLTTADIPDLSGTYYLATNPSGYQNATQVNTAITGSIINDVTHTDTNKSLSANMGKELNDRLNNVEGRGRFLSIWNSMTGLPITNPPGLEVGQVYQYVRGDYYIVDTVTTGTHYKPNGSSYTVGTASTTTETATVKENDSYLYDGTNWILLANTQQEVAFSSLAGSPYDNSNLSAALNTKQTTIDSTHKLSADLVDDSATTNKFVTAQDKTNWNNKVDKNNAITAGTKCKITYDTKGLVTGGSDLTASDIPDLSATYITLATDQTATAKKTFSYTEEVVVGGQETILNVLSTHTNAEMAAMWAGRMKIGNRNKTFLLGVYKQAQLGQPAICGLGAHSWSDSFAEENAAWEDIYLNPDGDKAVYIGGKDWRAGTGWFKVQNNGNNSGGKVYYNKGTITSPIFLEVATTTDVSNYHDSTKVTVNSTITGSTKCKITYDSKGLVTAGANLSASDIPSLSLSKITDVTATATEVNVLDGITATTTELNYTDGVTSNIQTQLDGKAVYPAQSGNSGKFLTTNGTSTSWATVNTTAMVITDYTA